VSVTINDIIQRAIGMSVQNNAATLTSNAPEMITQIGQYESDVYIAAAKANRFFTDSDTVTSTSGSSARTADLSTLTTLERIIRASITAGSLNRVDVEDPDAELSPRYYLLGQTMYEVEDDWGATGTVTITVDFATRPAALSPTGGLSQTVTLPDRWCPILSKRLAAYLSRKDVGRAPEEAQGFDDAAALEMAAMLASMELFGGMTHRRFISPEPFTPGSG